MSQTELMHEKVRRSWLLVPMSKEDRIVSAQHHETDVVVLDLVELVTEEDKPAARERVTAAIDQAKGGGAEVFAQVDAELLRADLLACVWPGLTGIIIARLESAEQIAKADALLERLEGQRGISPSSVEMVASLETARGNQDAYNISRASRRVWGLTLGRAELVMDLRPEPSGEIHLMQYLMQRLIAIAAATGKVPLGAWWRAPDRGLLATPDNTYQAARRGRAIGFKGSLCIQPDQVAPLNRGFTPSEDEVDEARRMLEAYQLGLDQGVAVIEEGDRIIDRGAAAQARALVDWSAACAARDEAKAAAAEGRPVPAP